MALNRKLTSGIGVTATVVSNTVGTGITHGITGFSISNVTAGTVTADVQYKDSGAGTAYQVKGIAIPANDTFNVVGGNDVKHVLIAGDSVEVTGNTAVSLDVVFSYLIST